MANDNWETPEEVFAWFSDDFKFVLDAAASDTNYKCMNYLTEKDDALTRDWHQMVSEIDSEGWVWLNCPYSNPMPWVDKAIETQAAGTGVVMLLNNDMSVRWFARALESVTEVRCFIANDEDRPNYQNGRIAFINGDTGLPVKQNNKPQFALIFDPHTWDDGVRTTYHTLKGVMEDGAFLLSVEKEARYG